MEHSGHLFDRDKYKRDIITKFYEKYNADDDSVVDIQAPVEDIVEPYLNEFAVEIRDRDLENRKKKYEERIDEIELIEELDMDSIDRDLNEEIFDIEILTNIEHNVIRFLQYLNLELYKSEDIKNFIAEYMLKEIDTDKLNDELEVRIKSVIKDIVDHEFDELSNKRKERKKDLVNESLTYFSNIIDSRIEERQSKVFDKITKFQNKVYKKYLIDVITDNELEVFKKKMKLNFEEYMFVKNLLRSLIEKKVI